MSEEIKITLNSSEAQADIEDIGDKADAVSEEVDQLMTEAEVKTDLTWLKAAHTVQQITTILRQALQIAGVSLGRVGSATLQVVTQAAAVLTPLCGTNTIWLADRISCFRINRTRYFCI